MGGREGRTNCTVAAGEKCMSSGKAGTTAENDKKGTGFRRRFSDGISELGVSMKRPQTLYAQPMAKGCGPIRGGLRWGIFRCSFSWPLSQPRLRCTAALQTGGNCAPQTTTTMLPGAQKHAHSPTRNCGGNQERCETHPKLSSRSSASIAPEVASSMAPIWNSQLESASV